MALSLILPREIPNSFVWHLAQRLALIMMLMDIHNEAPIGRNKAPGHTASQAEHLQNWISSIVLKIMSPRIASSSVDVA